ncbi:MAG: hypothetical protein ACRYGO_10500 [Janthinobacterium lividum]
MSWELLNTINQGIFRLMARLIPYNEQKWEVEHHTEKASFQISEVHRLAAEIQYARETSNNAEELERLSKSMEFRRVDMETHGAAAMAARKSLLALQEAYADAVIEESFEIGKKVDELVTCIRAELSLPTSHETLRALREANYAVALAATRELRATLRKNESDTP